MNYLFIYKYYVLSKDCAMAHLEFLCENYRVENLVDYLVYLRSYLVFGMSEWGSSCMFLRHSFPNGPHVEVVDLWMTSFIMGYEWRRSGYGEGGDVR